LTILAIIESNLSFVVVFYLEDKMANILFQSKQVTQFAFFPLLIPEGNSIDDE
jgi:hypothetical protein